MTERSKMHSSAPPTPDTRHPAPDRMSYCLSPHQRYDLRASPVQYAQCRQPRALLKCVFNPPFTSDKTLQIDLPSLKTTFVIKVIFSYEVAMAYQRQCHVVNFENAFTRINQRSETAPSPPKHTHNTQHVRCIRYGVHVDGVRLSLNFGLQQACCSSPPICEYGAPVG